MKKGGWLFVHQEQYMGFRHRCTYIRGMCTEKNRTLSQLGVGKIAFSRKPDIRTDRRT